MSKMKLEIITPNGSIFSGNVKTVTLPGSEGEFGVLAQHAGTVTLLNAGAIEIEKEDGSKEVVAISWGHAKVDEKSVDSPMLFIALTGDKVAPVELQKKIASKYKAKLAILQGCHWIFDSPHEIAEQIIKFVSEVL